MSSRKFDMLSLLSVSSVAIDQPDNRILYHQLLVIIAEYHPLIVETLLFTVTIWMLPYPVARQILRAFGLGPAIPGKGRSNNHYVGPFKILTKMSRICHSVVATISLQCSSGI